MSWIGLTFDGPVATISLSAPAGPSRINVESAKEWFEALEQVEAKNEVSVLVVRAEGSVWSAGGDLPEFESRGSDAHDYVLAIGEWINRVTDLLHRSGKLTVASVHGAVAGGGLGPMLACDFVVAASDTAFTLGYSRLATNPDAGVSWFLPRLVGYRKALELYLTSERLDARQAKDMGMVNLVVSPDELAAETQTRAEQFSRLPNHAVAATKRLLRQSEITPLDSHLEDEIRSFARNTRHPDFVEGVSAFLERRDPEFGGDQPG